MMRLSTRALGFILAPVIAGCAGGSSLAEVEPDSAEPATMPIEWFAENWGPFNASWIDEGASDGRRGPLYIVDGVHMHPDDMAAQTGPSADARLHPDKIAHIHVIKTHNCDFQHFGPAGAWGIVMIFTHDYDGPMPRRAPPAQREPCSGAGR